MNIFEVLNNTTLGGFKFVEGEYIIVYKENDNSPDVAILFEHYPEIVISEEEFVDRFLSSDVFEEIEEKEFLLALEIDYEEIVNRPTVEQLLDGVNWKLAVTEAINRMQYRKLILARKRRARKVYKISAARRITLGRNLMKARKKFRSSIFSRRKAKLTKKYRHRQGWY
jgi:hypothetical protein